MKVFLVRTEWTVAIRTAEPHGGKTFGKHPDLSSPGTLRRK